MSGYGDICDVDYDFFHKILIRTLRVSPIKADMSEQIEAYFQQFGTVNSVEIEKHQHSDTFFAMVEFNKVETACRVRILNGKHQINGCNIEVKAAMPWHQPDHILNALNDDCLGEILSRLNQMDLTNAANVCVRLNQLAKSVFSTKIKKLTLRIDCYDEAVRSLEIFGPLAQSVNIKSDYFGFGGRQLNHEHGILCMVFAQCNASILKELIITDFSRDSRLPNQMNLGVDLSKLSKLKRLSFVDCRLQNQVNFLLPFCVGLKVLHFERCQFYLDLIIPTKFGGLDELHLIDIVFSDLRFINDIAAMNKSLKKLAIHVVGDSFDINPSYAIAEIIGNFPNLLELDVNMHNDLGTFAGTENVYCLSNLKSLKVLKLNVDENIDRQLLKILTVNAIPIEHLQLTDGKIDVEFIKDISEMKQLKILKLCNFCGLTDEHLLELAVGLGSQLENLHLDGYTAKDLTTIGLKKMLPFATKLSFLTLKSQTMVIDVDDHKEILNTLKNRPAKIKLTVSFKLISVEDQIEVDKYVLMKNRDIFDIHTEVLVVESLESVFTVFKQR